MKKLLVTAAASLFLTATANAFVCDYNYVVQGELVKTRLQIEEIKGDKLLTMRSSKSDELVAALNISSDKKTRIGRVVTFYMTAEGSKVEGELVLPSVLPGPGHISWGEESTDPIQCRRDII